MDNDKKTRRGFLKLSVLGAGGAILASPRLPAMLATEVTSVSLATATCAQFRPHLGSTFRLVSQEGAAVAVELAKATELPARSQNGRRWPAARTPFSLLFRSSTTPELTQGICRVEHDRLGSFDLFLVRLSPDQRGRQRYEAIFG